MSGKLHNWLLYCQKRTLVPVEWKAVDPLCQSGCFGEESLTPARIHPAYRPVALLTAQSCLLYHQTNNQY